MILVPLIDLKFLTPRARLRNGGGDYSVHAVVGLDAEGRMYLLDLWRQRAAADEWVEAFCDLVLAWKPIGWAEEQCQIRSGVGPFLEKRMRERRAFVARAVDPRPHGAGGISCAGRQRHGSPIFAPSC